jgi:orotidine-5'-phosphate decarboxylase
MSKSEAVSERPTPTRIEDRLIVAVDVPTVAEARRIVSRLDGVVSFFKLGLWLCFAEGFDGLLGGLLRQNKKVFLDTKMFDIGETVKQGVRCAAERGVAFVTVHGDAEMMRAAVEGRGDTRLKIFAITVLTSVNRGGLRDLGYSGDVDELIRLRVEHAAAAGCDGVIASVGDNPNELRRRAGAERLLVATPGIRPAGAGDDGHKRPGTPRQAIAAGADYLVVGRPIVRAADPAAMARQIIEEMRAGMAG